MIVHLENLEEIIFYRFQETDVSIPGGIEADKGEMHGIGIILVDLVSVLAGRALGCIDGVRQPVRQQALSQELSQLRLRAGFGRPADLRNEKSTFGIRRIFERDEFHLGRLGHDRP